MIYPQKGYIGCFEMSDKDSAKRKLDEYIMQLKNYGHKKIIAPINGDTWHTYRLVSWSNNEPPFPLEPQNPIWYNEVYEEMGFKPLKKYRSDKICMEHIDSLTVNDFEQLHFRNFHEKDLKLFYELSLQSFEDNFLYSDITFEEFCLMYQPIMKMFDNELIMIAEVDNIPVGFMVSFPAKEQLILKTMAVIPEYRNNGIGATMFHNILLAGRRKGMKTAIAALFAENNISQKIVSKYESETIREYTIYCLEI